MVVYSDHPLIQYISRYLIKSARVAEYRWMNLREVKAVEDDC